jgi:23S rRNA pseudouridine1911/1915/1917 synthase
MKHHLEILFEDGNIIAINKPSGMLSIPDRFDKSKANAHDMLKAQTNQQIFVLHRIDKETSGILLFAKNEVAHKLFSKLFESNSIKKTYFAIIKGSPEQDQGSIHDSIAHDPSRPGKMKIHPKGKESHTEWKILERFKGYSILEIALLTGRTHQIRVHLAHIGYPLAVDSFYGKKDSLKISDLKSKARQGKSQLEFPDLINRCSLHAWKLSYNNPTTAIQINIEAPLPKDLFAVINQLRKHSK